MANDKTYHLLWGVGLFSLYVILFSIQVPIMRLCDSLLTSQTLALMSVSEAVFLLPFAAVIKREWNMTKTNEWTAFTALGLLLGSFNAATAFCSKHMNLGASSLILFFLFFFEKAGN